MTGLAFGNIQPYMGFGAGLKAFTAAVVGGIGSISGAMLGGMIIGIAEQMTIGYLSSAFQDIIVLSVLIVFMLFRPTGIRGTILPQKV
jgi:branched-chain amino acid transport system permease protein